MARSATSTELSGALLERSGIRELQRMLTDRYGRRAQALKARSALAALRVIGQELDRRGIAGASDVVVSVDRLEASSQDLALLRLLHLVLTGVVELVPGRARGGGPPVRLGSGRGARRDPGRRRRRGPPDGTGRHRAVAIACRQPAERPAHDRGGRDREPRLRGHLRRRPV